MDWSDKTNRALKKWLNPGTWYTDRDEGRFYGFLLAIWDDHQGIWNEAVARETMTRVAIELHPEVVESLVEKTVEEMLTKGTVILEFLSQMKDRGLHLT